MIRSICFILSLICISTSAVASDWLRAEGDQWVVHATLDEEDLRELMESLQDFDDALDLLLPAQSEGGEKLQIYLADSYTKISQVSTLRTSAICRSHAEFPISYAWYNPSQPLALRNWAVQHCIAQYRVGRAYLRPVPPWVSAGIPAFFATAYRSPDAGLIIGEPDLRRPLNGPITASELGQMLSAREWVSNYQLERWHDLSRELVRSLLSEQRHAGKLEKYLDAYASGVTMGQSAAALGDLSALAKDIERPLRAGMWSRRQLSLKSREPLTISVRAMSADEIAVIEPRFERLNARRREAAARKLRNLTQRYPDSALVWYEYAAAEYLRVQVSEFGGEPVFRGMGFQNGELIVSANPYSDAEAWRAVNEALRIDPDLPSARRLWAEIMLARLMRSGDLEDAVSFAEIRRMLAPLAGDAKRNPLAAAVYHESFVEQGIEPPEHAFQQLTDAFLANAWVEEFRYAYAVALIRRGETEKAKYLLASLLNDPEFEETANRALEQTP